MGFRAPPSTLDGIPSHALLPAGAVLHRVHPASTPPDAFDTPRPEMFGGAGRFDATIGSGYRTLCASATPETAIAERFLREFAATPGVHRYLVRRALAGQMLSELRTVIDLALLKLTSPRDLAAVHQDGWLIDSRAGDFPATREWAAWLHDQVPWAQGILWQAATDMPRDSVVLFEDRCPRTLPVAPGRGRVLDAPENAGWLADLLAPQGIRTQPAEPRAPRYFINYRPGDGDDAARLVHNELSRRLGERQVFRSVPPGSDGCALVRGCRVALTVVGRTWEWHRQLADPADRVRREVLEARAHGACVVPVLVGDRSCLRAEDLPEPLRFLVGAQFLRLPDRFEHDDVELVVTRLLAQESDN